MAHVFGAVRFLTVTKPLGGVRPIAVEKNIVLTHKLCFMFSIS
jgi:hypothetical protein